MTLVDFFKQNTRAALGFSGGVDSAFLLWAAKHWGGEVRAYYVKSPFQPQFELADARRLAEELGADMQVLELDVLAVPEIAENPCNRCYFCKKQIFSTIAAAAKADGFDLLLDGTNASDDAGDRPGMQALAELQVRSPLRECGLTKGEIRRLSKEAGLFTWNKPAYACLATRIPTGEVLTKEKLQAIDTISRLGMNVARSEQYIENLLHSADPQPECPNIRSFLRSVSQTLSRIQQSGIAAVSERRETENQIILTITIPK